MELRLPSTSGLFAPKSELRDARSATIIGLHALALLLFSWKPLVAGGLLAVGLVLTFGLTRPLYLALVCVGMLWVNDLLADFWPMAQYTAWKDVLLLIIIAGWAIRSFLLNQTPFPVTSVTLPLTLVLIMYVAMTTLSASPVQAALGLKATVFYAMWYYITPDIVKSKRDLALLIGAIVFGVACMGVYNIWRYPQPYGTFPTTRLGKLLPGAAVVHWSGSAYLLPSGLLIGTAVLGHVRGWLKLPLIIALILGGTGIMLTNGRAQWFGMLVALAVMGFSSGRLITYGKMLLMVLIISGIVQTVLPIKLAERAVSAFSDEDVSRNAREAETWSVTIPYVLTHPFGAGTGSLTSAYSAKVWSKSSLDTVIRNGTIHNNLLLVAIETGWLGAVAWTWFLVTAVLGARKVYFETSDPFLKDVGLGLFGVMASYAVMNFFAPMTVASLISFGFWVLVGLIPVIPALDQKNHSKTSAVLRVQG